MRKILNPPSRIYFQCLTAFDYFMRQAEATPTRLILLLHGNGGTGKMFYDKFTGAFPKNAIVLAPNAPFPVRVDEADGTFRWGYTWYFFDNQTQTYLLDMRHAVEFMTKAIAALKLESLDKTIIGFSQGGYLSLSLAGALTHVKQVIGVGCEFVHDDAVQEPTFPVDGIHGEKDTIISVEAGKKSHLRLQERGFKGTFTTLADKGHAFDSLTSETALKTLL